MCKLCQRKPKFETREFSLVAKGQWVRSEKNLAGIVDEMKTDFSFRGSPNLFVGVDANGRVYLLAEGMDIRLGRDGRSGRYYPKFCPECGRRLRTD